MILFPVQAITAPSGTNLRVLHSLFRVGWTGDVHLAFMNSKFIKVNFIFQQIHLFIHQINLFPLIFNEERFHPSLLTFVSNLNEILILTFSNLIDGTKIERRRFEHLHLCHL